MFTTKNQFNFYDKNEEENSINLLRPSALISEDSVANKVSKEYICIDGINYAYKHVFS